MKSLADIREFRGDLEVKAESLRNAIREAQVDLARDAVGDARGKPALLGSLRAKLQDAEDTLCGLDQVAAEVEHRDLAAGLSAVNAERAPVLERIRCLDVEIAALDHPPFSAEKFVELKRLRESRQTADTARFDADQRVAKIQARLNQLGLEFGLA
jgi:hypothetical protein